MCVCVCVCVCVGGGESSSMKADELSSAFDSGLNHSSGVVGGIATRMQFFLVDTKAKRIFTSFVAGVGWGLGVGGFGGSQSKQFVKPSVFLSDTGM